MQLNSVFEIKFKKMMNFVLEDLNIVKPLFNLRQMANEELRAEEEVKRMNHMQTLFIEKEKLGEIQANIVEKVHEVIQKMFEFFVREFVGEQSLLFKNKMIFYCLLKTEGDIMIELRDYNRAL